MGVELKVALVGCGVITQRTLSGLSAILKASRGFISALCDPVESNRRKVAHACGANKVAEYSDLDRLLYESDCDAVFIATPIGMHFEHVRKALNAGRHVYCHKTLATSAEACEELASLAEANGLTLAASPGQILLPAYARAQDLIVAKELGELVSIDAGTEAAPHRYEAERAGEDASTGLPFSWEWYHKWALGGGPLDDMFVYPLAFLTEVLGDVTRAAARGRIVCPRIEWHGRIVEADVPDSFAGLLEFGKVIATFRASFSANGRKVPWGTICIRGTKACLEIEKHDDASYRLYLTSNEGTERIEYHGAQLSGVDGGIGTTECHVLTDMAEFLSACCDNRPVRGATAENAARVAHGLSLVRQSADKGGAWTAPAISG